MADETRTPEELADERLRRLIGELHLHGATPGTLPVTEGDQRVFRAVFTRRGATVDAMVSTPLAPGAKTVYIDMTVTLP